MQRVTLEPAYVLHRRAYRETSFLVEILTPTHGRLTVLARGVRKIRSQAQGLLQPFVPILISWTGKGELMTLTQVEPNGEIKRLCKDNLFAGLYINELLMHLVQKWDPQPTLFLSYQQTLQILQDIVLAEETLRTFEKKLLEELGYGLLTKSDYQQQALLQEQEYYRFIPEQGFVSSTFDPAPLVKSNLFLGKNLLAIAREDWYNADILQDAKRLMRLVLLPLLGTKTIHSRELFRRFWEVPS